MNEFEKNEGAAPCPASAPSKEANPYDSSIRISQKNSNLHAFQFLKLIAENESHTFQTFDDAKGSKKSGLTRILHGDLEEHLEFLEALNKRGAGIFYTVNATDLKGRTAKNIVRIRAAYIDLDGAPLEPVQAAPLPPHIIVESSPGRYHAYWLIDGLPLEEFTFVQKALIKKFGADPAVHDLPRVMRLPGFLHQKGEPCLVKILEFSGTSAYHASDFIKAFQIAPPKAAKERGFENISDPVLHELKSRSMIKRPIQNKPGGWDILCPWRDSHTTGNEGTAYFEPYTNGFKGAGFKCQHSHCEGKGIGDLREFLNLEEEWADPVELKSALHPVSFFQETMLPKALRPWIMDIAERMQVPSDFLGSACMVILGSLIGRKIGIYPKAFDDWLVIPNLWGAIVGRPSLLKSPAIAEMMKPLDELAEKAVKKYREDMRIYEQQEMWVEAKRSAQKEQMKKAAKGSEMPVLELLDEAIEPISKRYKTEDATVEKIGELLLKNPQGILVHRDELVGWFKGFDKHGREGDRAFFLEAWNGNGSYTVDRIGRGTLYIPALCISIIGGIQPGPLGSYVSQAASGGGGDDGFLQRFQLLVWPDVKKQWENVDRPPDLNAREQAMRVFRLLDAFEPFEPCLNGAFETFKLRFDSEAQIQSDEWRTSHEQRLRSGSLEPALESHLAKYRSLMPSLALIFYLVETLGIGEEPLAVDAGSVQQAIQWCEYLETHARRLYASREHPSMDSARSLLDRIKKGFLVDGFSSRDVYHGKHWANLDDAEKVENAIKVLEEFGWVKSESLKTLGRPAKRIWIHPQLKRST